MKKQAVAAIVLLIIICFSFFALSLALRWTAAPWVGEVEKREQQVGSGEWKRVTYNHYYDLCAAIKGNYMALQTQEEYRHSLESGTKEWRRVSQTVAGLEQQIKRDIAQYNADVHKKYTKAIMYDHDLPYKITMEKLRKGEIQCS